MFLSRHQLCASIACCGFAVQAAALSRARIGVEANVSLQDATFMVVSGVSSQREMCLTVENGLVETPGAGLVLMGCQDAIAAGDGRELFQFQTGGRLMNVVGKQCVALSGNDVQGGGALALESCDAAVKYADGRASFEFQGNAQLRLGRDGGYCVSQSGGSGVASENVALHAAATATSTADALAHGANMAVDGRSDTFWASKLGDAAGPVEFTVDFGAERNVQRVDVHWAFAPKAFSVHLFSGGRWSQVYSTDSNVLNVTRAPLGSKAASMAKLVLRSPHPLYGRLHSRTVYGISALAIVAASSKTIVEECPKAAQSIDARDKFFMSSVGQFDPCPGKALRGELPALEAAKSSLAATTGELAEALSRASACSRNAAALLHTRASVGHATGLGAGGPADEFDDGALGLLMAEARKAILTARGALA